MFPAEVTTIFMNLLTNAVKAAGVGGRILATASLASDRLDISIANTGTEVDLETAERWFRPFESTTVQVDPLLGQGLGLGLPITRSVVEEYGGDIRFIPPPAGYSSAVQVSIPGGRRR
jgi:signal transduction histidine kinase